MKKYVWLLILALFTGIGFAAEDYIIPFYTWQTGDTITNPRLNGNVTNVTGGLAGGTKVINVGKVLMNGTAVINSSRAITATTGQFSSTLGVSGNATFETLTVTTLNNTALTTTLNTLVTSANTLTTSVNSIQSDLNGFPDELKNLTTAEIQQVENIGTNTLSAAIWGYLAGINQNLGTGASPTFVGITGTLATAAQGNITSLGTLTGLTTGKIVGNATGEQFSRVGTTGLEYMDITNTSGGMYWGVEGSSGGGLVGGSTAYDTAIRSTLGVSIGSASALWSRLTSTGLTLAGGLNVGSNATGAVANAVNINGAKLNSGYALNIKTDGTLDGGIQQHNGSATMFSVQGNGTGYFAGGLNVGTTGAGAGAGFFSGSIYSKSDTGTGVGLIDAAGTFTRAGLQIECDGKSGKPGLTLGTSATNGGNIYLDSANVLKTDDAFIVADTTDSTSGTTGSFHTDGGIGVAKHVVAGGGIDAGANGTYMKCKVIPIGDWNMDSTTQITVAHGLTLSKIRNVQANIRNDGDDLYMTIKLTFNGAVQGSADTYDGTSVILNRLSGGAFDSDTFDSTSYNRGYITIWYEE